MNELVKGGLWLLTGVVIGTAGATLLSRQEGLLRGAMVGTLAQGMAAKDKVLSSLEKAKEGVEDMVAEARHVQSGSGAAAEAAGEEAAESHA